MAELDVFRRKELLLAQLHRDKSAVTVGLMDVDQNGVLVNSPITTPLAECVDGYKADMDDRDKQRAINILRIVAKAQEEAADSEETISEQPVEPDWITRWRTYAQDVTNEDMQELWANLLTGEVRSPGSFSLFTLELVSNLTAFQARLIQKLFSYTFEDGIFHNMELNAKHGLTINDMIDLAEINMLVGFSSSTPLDRIFPSCTSDVFEAHIRFQNKLLIICSDDPKYTYRCGCIPLTKRARELRLLGMFDCNINYLIELAQTIKNKTNCKVLIADFVGLHYFDAVEV